MNLNDLGRLCLGAALVLGVVGGVMLLAARAGLGRLPGDLSLGGDGVHVYVPLATCLLISVVASVVLNLLLRR